MDDFDNLENEYEYKDEANAWDRTNIGGVQADLLVGIDTEKMNKDTDPKDVFIKRLNAVAQKLISLKKITQFEVDIVLKKTRYVVDLENKNYNAYLLGYFATRKLNKDNELDPEAVKYAINDILPILKQGGNIGVEAPDVVRYARYWHKFLLDI